MKVVHSEGFFNEKVFRSMCTIEKRRQAASLRAGSSRYTSQLWGLIRCQALGCRFSRRVPVFGMLPAFWCHRLRLAVDVTDPAADKETLTCRDRYLARNGVTIVQVSKLDITMAPGTCVRFLESVIEQLKQGQESQC